MVDAASGLMWIKAQAEAGLTFRLGMEHRHESQGCNDVSRGVD